MNIEPNAIISFEKVEIGDNSGIGPNSRVGAAVIGKDVMMGPDVIILSRNHRFSSLEVPMRLQGGNEDREVFVGDDVWIGSQVIILPGVRIGNGSIIGAGSVVTGDVPEYCVYAGNPASFIKVRR